jgi:type IV pilus assembly protein PilC
MNAMPEFVCKIGAPGGEIFEKSYTSDSAESLRQSLQGQGFYVFHVARRNVLFETLATPFRKRASRIRQDEFLVFNQEFAALIKAGLPILQGLEILLERMKPGLFRDTMEKVTREVREGKPLSQAFSDCGPLFPPIYCASLQAGERSGNLHEVLTRFIRYTRLIYETRKRVVSMLIYPAILLCVSGVVIGILMFYALPSFSTIYQGREQELPQLTLLVMGVSSFLVRNVVYIAVLVLAAFMAYKSYVRLTAGRIHVDGIKLQIPLLGPLMSKFNTTHYVRTLATLLGGGIPAVQALEVAGNSLGNAYFVQRSQRVVERVREGASIQEAMEETRLFEHLALEMVKVGESSGALTEMLHNLADFYDEDIDTTLRRVISIMEPVIIIALALIVGTILISLYLPIFETAKII